MITIKNYKIIKINLNNYNKKNLIKIKKNKNNNIY